MKKKKRGLVDFGITAKTTIFSFLRKGAALSELPGASTFGEGILEEFKKQDYIKLILTAGEKGNHPLRAGK